MIVVIPILIMLLIIWKEMAMRHEKMKNCEVCNRVTNHKITEYTDERIERCTQCKTRTITIYEENNKPIDKQVKKEDRIPPEKKLGRPKKGNK